MFTCIIYNAALYFYIRIFFPLFTQQYFIKMRTDANIRTMDGTMEWWTFGFELIKNISSYNFLRMPLMNNKIKLVRALLEINYAFLGMLNFTYTLIP